MVEQSTIDSAIRTLNASRRNPNGNKGYDRRAESSKLDRLKALEHKQCAQCKKLGIVTKNNPCFPIALTCDDGLDNNTLWLNHDALNPPNCKGFTDKRKP